MGVVLDMSEHLTDHMQIYDNPGETTVLAAAEVVHSLIQLMADKPVKPTKGVKKEEL